MTPAGVTHWSTLILYLLLKIYLRSQYQLSIICVSRLKNCNIHVHVKYPMAISNPLFYKWSFDLEIPYFLAKNSLQVPGIILFHLNFLIGQNHENSQYPALPTNNIYSSCPRQDALSILFYKFPGSFDQNPFTKLENSYPYTFKCIRNREMSLLMGRQFQNSIGGKLLL